MFTCVTHGVEGTDTLLSQIAKALAMGSSIKPIPESYLCQVLNQVPCSQAILGPITKGCQSYILHLNMGVGKCSHFIPGSSPFNPSSFTTASIISKILSTSVPTSLFPEGNLFLVPPLCCYWNCIKSYSWRNLALFTVPIWHHWLV